MKQLLGNDARIIKYSQLSDYASIDKLLPNKFDYVILLVELVENVGHFECLVRNGNNIFFFDPYGVRVDKSLLFADKQVRRELGQKYPLLSHMLNDALDAGFNVQFNSYQYQEKNGNINTCGRWCSVFINFMKRADEKHKNLISFNTYVLQSAKAQEFKNLDMWVTAITT